MRKPKDPLVVEHKDRGCKAFAVCLKCPLPRCRMDPVPRDDTALSPLSRAIEMVKLRNQNWMIRELSACYKVSERTVYRALRSQTSAELIGTAAPSPAPAASNPKTSLRGRRSGRGNLSRPQKRHCEAEGRGNPSRRSGRGNLSLIILTAVPSLAPAAAAAAIYPAPKNVIARPKAVAIHPAAAAAAIYPLKTE